MDAAGRSLMLEIVARSELHTIIRRAATSKPLRNDILHPSFIHRVSRQAPCILIYLRVFFCNPFVLVNPGTFDATSFCDDHLFPFLLRRDDNLFDQYSVMVSRRGFVLLRRLIIKDRLEIDSCFDLCVYDPMSGARTFLSEPAEIQNYDDEYVLLTAADGINCSFLLLVTIFCGWSIGVRTASSCGTWGPVTYFHDHDLPCYLLRNHCNPAVLHGGTIHWLKYNRKDIQSYNVGTRKVGSVKLPHTNCGVNNQLHLVTSSDGEVLKLLTIERFMLSVWLQLPIPAAGGNDWSREAVIDTEEKLRSLFPDIVDGLEEPIEFRGSGKRSGEVVFLKVRTRSYSDAIVVFDLETKEMHAQNQKFSLLEIDLLSRLQSMKIFS